MKNTRYELNDMEIENVVGGQNVDDEESSEPVEDVVIGLIEGYQYDIEDLNGMWKNLSVLCNNLDPAVVVIRNAENNDELFPAVDDHSEEYSGIVIAETYNEAIILTPADAVNGEEDYVPRGYG